MNTTIIEPIIKFKPHKSVAEMRCETFKRKFRQGAQQVERYAKVYICSNTEPECIFRSVREYRNAYNVNKLNLTNADRFTWFRDVLEGPIQLKWDSISGNYPQTNNGFDQAIAQLIAEYTDAGALDDQKQYFDEYTKPHWVKVKEVTDRFDVICDYMTQYRGANGAEPYTQDEKKKKVLKWMPLGLKIAWRRSVHFTAPNFTYTQFVNFLQTEEQCAKVVQQVRQNQGQGRGNGRGNGGNYRSRTTTPPYNPRPQQRQRTQYNRTGHPENERRFGPLYQYDNRGNCPFHSNHTWGNCLANPSNPRYSSTFIIRDNANTRGQQTRSGGTPYPPPAARAPAPGRGRGPPPGRGQGGRGNFRPAGGRGGFRRRDNYTTDDHYYNDGGYDANDQQEQQQYDEYDEQQDQYYEQNEQDEYYTQQEEPSYDSHNANITPQQEDNHYFDDLYDLEY